jgi:ABC-2 type transport system permease protein
MIRVRSVGRVNWLGILTLVRREYLRMLDIYKITLLAPAVTALLLLAVFGLILGELREEIGGVPAILFVAPGLIAFSMMERTFEDSSITIMYDKMEGIIGDVLTPPLGPAELITGYLLSGIGNGIANLLIVGTAVWAVSPMPVENPLLLAAFVPVILLLMSGIGMIVGIFCRKWDQWQAVETFGFMPLTYLSGMFFTADRLPESLRWIVEINPFYYAIDGMRAGFLGSSQVDPATAFMVVGGSGIAVVTVVYLMFRAGYRMKD